jgi:hypothetical protein
MEVGIVIALGDIPPALLMTSQQEIVQMIGFLVVIIHTLPEGKLVDFVRILYVLSDFIDFVLGHIVIHNENHTNNFTANTMNLVQFVHMMQMINDSIKPFKWEKHDVGIMLNIIITGMQFSLTAKLSASIEKVCPPLLMMRPLP